MLTSSKKFFAISPLVAEAVGVLERLMIGKNLLLSSVIIELDNLVLIEACRGNIVREEIKGIINDIISLKYKFSKLWFYLGFKGL